MKAQELKLLLHESIENVDDEAVLNAVHDLLERKYQSHDAGTLPAEQIQKIAAAKSQIANGEFLTNEQADKIVDRWLIG